MLSIKQRKGRGAWLTRSLCGDIQPVLHEPGPGVPDDDVVGGGEEDGRPEGGHHPPVVTPRVPHLLQVAHQGAPGVGQALLAGGVGGVGGSHL